MKVAFAALAAMFILAGVSACDSNDLTTGELEITDLIVGTGLVAAANDSVRVYYVLTRSDDDLICDLHGPNNSAGQPQDPLGFSLDDVVDGFRDGLVGAREGGRRRIIVPPNLGYGLDPPANQTCIRSNEVLDFTVDLVEVIKP
jgi:peptidylprolyl isomerase